MFLATTTGTIARTSINSIPRLKSPHILSRMSLLTISASIKDGLTKNGVVPDVVDSFEPKGLLTVSYGKGKEVAMGNTLAVEETQHRPQFQFTLNGGSEATAGISSTVSNKDRFVLVLTDPDAPSRTDKKWSEYAHYIATGITLPGADSPAGASSSGKNNFLSAEIDPARQGTEILEYQGPAPPSGTGKHRYVFLLFRQPQGVASEVPAPTGRPNWGTGIPASGVRDWSKKHGLELLAVNFFYAQNK